MPKAMTSMLSFYFKILLFILKSGIDVYAIWNTSLILLLRFYYLILIILFLKLICNTLKHCSKSKRNLIYGKEKD